MEALFKALLLFLLYILKKWRHEELQKRSQAHRVHKKQLDFLQWLFDGRATQPAFLRSLLF